METYEDTLSIFVPVSLRICMISTQALLAFIVSLEKSGYGFAIMLLGLFSLAAFIIFSLFCALTVLIIM